MTSSDIIELRRICCAIMGELGTVTDHIGTLSGTLHTPSTPTQDARARAETLANAEEAAGMIAMLADELAKELHTQATAEEAELRALENAKPQTCEVAS